MIISEEQYQRKNYYTFTTSEIILFVIFKFIILKVIFHILQKFI
jgi:hypothetical protein